MPHKHTRKEVNKNDFDLAPTTRAKPLPTIGKTTPKSQAKPQANRGSRKPQPKKSEPAKDLKPKRKRGGGDYDDDTPKEFQRLMRQATERKKMDGLDDGEPRKKKPKVAAKDGGSGSGKNSAAEGGKKDGEKKTKAEAEKKAEVPKIMPGEKMSEFSARVNAAMPVSGLARKGKANIEGMKERRTKTEKRLHKLYAEWRTEEEKLKEREEEAREKAEEAEEEKEKEFGGQSIKFPESGRASRRRRREIGETGEREEDPWKALERERGGRARLGDVVQAPPELKVVPREKFKVKGGARVDVATVPKGAGSLRKREELGDARREVIERYREMMRGRHET